MNYIRTKKIIVALVFFCPPSKTFYSRPKIASSLNPHSLLIAPNVHEYIHNSWFLPDLVSFVSNSEFLCLKRLKMDFPSCQLNVDSLFIDLPSPFHPFLHLPTPPPLSNAVLSIPNKRLPIYLQLGILIDTIEFGLF